MENSIINSTDGNVACDLGASSATLTSDDFNIASDSSCHLTQSNDHPGTDPIVATPGLLWWHQLHRPTIDREHCH